MKISLLFFALIISSVCFSQNKQYAYYFDKDLNSTDQAHAIFYGMAQDENGSVKLMLYNNSDKHLIMIEHFTDSSLQLSNGLFGSYYANTVKESEGNYISGKQDGLWQRWDSSGNIIDSLFYENGNTIMDIAYNYYPDRKVEIIVSNDFKNHKFRRMFYTEGGSITRTDTSAEDDDKVFTKTETEAEFPGGKEAWISFIEKAVKERVTEFIESDYGTCRIKFIVDESGSILKMEQINNRNPKLASMLIDAVKNGPKWIPAQQNGRKVKSYKIITVGYNGFLVDVQF